MRLEEYENIVPNTNLDGLIFMTPNQHCAWRVETLYTKEPDTIDWINKMGPEDVLFDVGANMGQYSMLAAKRGVRVHAFEPESQNFALMCRNISVNKLGDLITPWPVALTARNGLGDFHVTSLMPGGSCNTFGMKVNYQLQEKDFAFKQGCWGMQMDDFVMQEDRPDIRPTHIKIDVDGIEHLVLHGAVIALGYAKSVLVETNTHLPQHIAIESFMNERGFAPDLPTAEIARRKEGPFEGIGNVIYYRKEK